ncbi:glucose-6-phosphate isomerase [Campylobacter sp. MIT 97-5078]|uniref:glucose-6-phosphate isomerase n=1 Tax=Campylobacter sp. MIT 97-5078 TaxID=1548153 RepID=UPI0005132CC9|nr:glucose-6-phosphate isomerase [Campylobacter sp. MIT 97-5078]KGI56289.1 glucose-6-phosphate isomerase [Campylobacter sp. MIT 97-5078]TQR27795.1 glucose-6-phosphate isomerase [Campylobacter sp. MIT 97-5078]
MLTNHFFFKTAQLDTIKAYAKRINDEFESKEIGYYHLADNTGLISECEQYFQNKNYKSVILLGMGGSSCGVKALRDFLAQQDKGKCKLFILDNSSNLSLTKVLEQVSLEDSLFIVASKTGTTIEVVSLFKLIMAHFKLELKDLYKNFIFITDENSKLHKLGEQLGVKCFLIPSNVGGRFSVLSAVGVVPLFVCGYDVKALLDGALACKKDFFEKKQEGILQKAYHCCMHKYANISVLFSYGDAFKGFNEWFVQLIAESLGKKQGYKRLGITPIALIGARDQHSFLQLIMQGPKDKMITFLRVKELEKSMCIPKLSLPYLEDCDFSNGIDLQKLLNAQCEATLQALVAENLSVDLIELDRLDEWHGGYLMYYYELLTSACGVMLGINTYDQPGVEVGKLILKKILS